jgi:hypothetical protein
VKLANPAWSASQAERSSVGAIDRTSPGAE